MLKAVGEIVEMRLLADNGIPLGETIVFEAAFELRMVVLARESLDLPDFFFFLPSVTFISPEDSSSVFSLIWLG